MNAKVTPLFTDEEIRQAVAIDLLRMGRDLKVIQSEDITEFLKKKREEKSRIVPAERLAEEGKRRMLIGYERQEGLTFPWAKANNLVLVRGGKLVLWTGWSFHGKSQMTKQIMVQAIHQGYKVCIASMEEEILAIWEEMAYVALGTSNVGPRDVDAWIEFCRGKLWFYDQEGKVQADRIKTVIRYAATELGVQHFVVDSLMLLGVARDDYEAQSLFVADLKTIASDTGCTIHLVAHMRKRDGKGGDDKPGNMHDISGGHEIGSLADYIFVVWRDKSESTQFPSVLKVEKQRGRINWTGTIGLGYDKSCRQYTDGGVTRFCGENEAPI